MALYRLFLGSFIYSNSRITIASSKVLGLTSLRYVALGGVILGRVIKLNNILYANNKRTCSSDSIIKYVKE